MQKVIGVINQKGGSGKTTVSNALAYEFAIKQGKKTLLIDFDPQASMTVVYFDMDPNQYKGTSEHNVGGIFDKDRKYVKPIYNVRENLDFIPANIELADRVEMATAGKDVMLRRYIEEHCGDYDVILIDSNPSFSTLMSNVILCCNTLVMPVGTSSLDEAGSKGFVDIIKDLFELFRYGPEYFYILPTKYDKRRNDDKLVLSGLHNEITTYMKNDRILSKIKHIIPLEPIPEKSVAKDAAAARMFTQEYIEKYSRTQRDMCLVFERVAKQIANGTDKE